MHQLCVAHTSAFHTEITLGSLLPQTACDDLRRDLASQPPILTAPSLAKLAPRSSSRTTDNATVLDYTDGIEAWLKTIMIVSELNSCKHIDMLEPGGYGMKPGHGGHYMLAQMHANLLLKHIREIGRMDNLTPDFFSESASSLINMLCHAVVSDRLTLGNAIATKSEQHTLVITRVCDPFCYIDMVAALSDDY